MSDTETLVRPEDPKPDRGRRRRENALWFTQSFVATLVLAGLVWGGVTLVNAFTTPVRVPAHSVTSPSPSKTHRKHLEPSEAATVPVAPPKTFTPPRHRRHHHRKVVVVPTTPFHPAPTTQPAPTAEPTQPLPVPTSTTPAPVQTAPDPVQTTLPPPTTATTAPPGTTTPTGIFAPTTQEGTPTDAPSDPRQESTSPVPHGPHAGR